MGKKKQKYTLGSIVAIPLPNGQYAYAKVFKNYDLGIYKLLTKQIEPPEKVKKNPIAFFRSTTDIAIVSGEWPVIGEEPFIDDDSAWGPPIAFEVIPDLGVGLDNPRIKHMGKVRKATMKELKGLDREVFAQRPDLLVEEIVVRLIEGKPSEYAI